MNCNQQNNPRSDWYRPPSLEEEAELIALLVVLGARKDFEGDIEVKVGNDWCLGICPVGEEEKIIDPWSINVKRIRWLLGEINDEQ